MTFKDNEKGMSLIEVLATVVILSIIIIALGNFLGNAFKINEREVTKNELRQEANLISHTIQNYHTRYFICNITIVEDELVIEAHKDKQQNCNKVASDYTKATFNNSGFKYTLKARNGNIINSLTNIKESFYFYITISSKHNNKVSIDLKTTFNKLYRERSNQGE